MLIDRSKASGSLGASSTKKWRVTLGTMQTEEIEGTDLHVEGGALVIKNGVTLVVAFGIGGWVEVAPA